MTNSLKRIKTTDLTELRAFLLEDVNSESTEEESKNNDTSINIDNVQIVNTLTNESEIKSANKENIENHNNETLEKPFETELNENSLINHETENKENRQGHKSRNFVHSTVNKNTLSRPPFILTRIGTKHSMYSREKMNEPKNDEEVYKSIHYSRIVESEERLSQRMISLQASLEKEILTQASQMCEESMNEARQLVQNSVAVSRIVSGLITDFSGLQSRLSTSLVDPKLSDSHTSHPTQKSVTTDPSPLHLESTEDTADERPMSQWGLMLSKSVENVGNFHPAVWNRDVAVFGYSARVDSQLRREKPRTEHRLDESEPHLKRWVEKKKIQQQIEEDERKEQEIAVQRADMMVEREKETRLRVAKEAYEVWRKDKEDETQFRMELEGRQCCAPTTATLPQPQHRMFPPPRPRLSRPRTAGPCLVPSPAEEQLRVRGVPATLSGFLTHRLNRPALWYPPVTATARGNAATNSTSGARKRTNSQAPPTRHLVSNINEVSARRTARRKSATSTTRRVSMQRHNDRISSSVATPIVRGVDFDSSAVKTTVQKDVDTDITMETLYRNPISNDQPINVIDTAGTTDTMITFPSTQGSFVTSGADVMEPRVMTAVAREIAEKHVVIETELSGAESVAEDLECTETDNEDFWSDCS